MAELFNSINSIVWSPALVFLCLGAGLYFSVRTRFLQLRHFREMLRFVSGEYYKRYDSVSQYNAARREELLQQGKNIDYAE